ncbi:MAG TPA: hypothetical protein VIM58_08870 [Candidatus Methylacidiphilales bacterium]
MSDSPRILVASNDASLNLGLDGLLGAFRASVFYAETEEMLVTFLTSPEGFDLVVLDAACAEISMQAVYRAMQKQGAMARTFLLMLLPDLNPGTAIFAYNLGADALLPRQFDVPSFLAVCRNAIRQAGFNRRLAALEKKFDEIEEPDDMEGETVAEEEPGKPKAVVLGGSEDKNAMIPASANLPPLVRHVEKALLQFFAEMQVAPKDIESKEPLPGLLRGDFVGWNGIFLPASSDWYDLVLNFTRPGAEFVSGELYGRGTDDQAILTALADMLGRVHALYRENSETGRGPSSAVFTQPLALPRFPWINELGAPTCSLMIRMPKLVMICDFYQTRGGAKIKPAGAIEPGDVMNENIAAPGQSRMALVNRGVVLTEERLRKVVPMVEATRNFWVIEPSLMTRRLHAPPAR